MIITNFNKLNKQTEAKFVFFTKNITHLDTRMLIKFNTVILFKLNVAINHLHNLIHITMTAVSKYT